MRSMLTASKGMDSKARGGPVTGSRATNNTATGSSSRSRSDVFA